MNHTRLAIIGSGPAGYTAAIYASRAKLEPFLFAGMESGGQLMYTTDLENFPGFPEGVPGPELMMNLRKQAEKFGANIIQKHVTAVDFSKRPFKLWTKLPSEVDPSVYKLGDREQILEAVKIIKQKEPDLLADTVIASTGAIARRLNIPGEAKLIGKGVSTCAVCDAAFFRDKKVYVIGGGDSAMEDAMALTKFTDQVTIIHRRSEFRASQIMQERVLANEKIDVIYNADLKEIHGDQVVKEIVVEVNENKQTLPAEGVFLAIGHKPVSAIFEGQLQLDDHHYIVTNQSPTKQGLKMAKKRLNNGVVELATLTSVPGVFAAGDVVDFRYQQAITASGLGAQAALDVEKWLSEHS